MRSEAEGTVLDMIERHFAAENAHDVQATLDTYTDDSGGAPVAAFHEP